MSLNGPAATERLFLFDLDDTLWDLKAGTFKNMHLLIPLLLYITHTQSCYWGIATNRRQKDTRPIEEDLSLDEIIPLLFNLGIKTEDTLIATHGDIEDTLSLTMAYHHSQTEPPLVALGKNMMLQYLHNNFNKVCKKNIGKENITLVDDDGHWTILVAAHQSGYRTVLATSCFDKTVPLDDDKHKLFYKDKLPQGHDKQSPLSKDNVGYLFELAEQAGLIDYINAVKQAPKRHVLDNESRKIAALLFECAMPNALDTQARSTLITELFPTFQVSNFAFITGFNNLLKEKKLPHAEQVQEIIQCMLEVNFTRTQAKFTGQEAKQEKEDRNPPPVQHQWRKSISPPDKRASILGNRRSLQSQSVPNTPTTDRKPSKPKPKK